LLVQFTLDKCNNSSALFICSIGCLGLKPTRKSLRLQNIEASLVNTATGEKCDIPEVKMKIEEVTFM